MVIVFKNLKLSISYIQINIVIDNRTVYEAIAKNGNAVLCINYWVTALGQLYFIIYTL